MQSSLRIQNTHDRYRLLYSGIFKRSAYEKSHSVIFAACQHLSAFWLHYAVGTRRRRAVSGARRRTSWAITLSLRAAVFHLLTALADALKILCRAQIPPFYAQVMEGTSSPYSASARPLPCAAQSFTRGKTLASDTFCSLPHSQFYAQETSARLG